MHLAILLSTVPLFSSTQALLPAFSPNTHHPEPLMSVSTPSIFSAPSPHASTLLLSDILSTQKPLTIFASLTRDNAPLTARLSDPSTNTTLLCPSNTAMKSLPHKPWESPQDYETLGTEAYKGDVGQQRADENLKGFVEGHVVPVSPWEKGQKVRCLAGGEVWWEEREGGKRVVMPGEVEVEMGVGKKVGNGEVWVLTGVLGGS